MRGNSPYQKYNKRPLRYSELYNQWRAAIKDGSKNTSLLGEKHSLYWLGEQYREIQRATRGHQYFDIELLG